MNHVFKHFIYLLIPIVIFLGCEDSPTETEQPEGPISLGNLEAAADYAMLQENGNPKDRAVVIWHEEKFFMKSMEVILTDNTFILSGADPKVLPGCWLQLR